MIVFKYSNFQEENVKKEVMHSLRKMSLQFHFRISYTEDYIMQIIQRVLFQILQSSLQNLFAESRLGKSKKN